MSAMRKFLTIVAGALLLVGCSVGATHAEIAERIQIEFTDDESRAESFTELIDTMADDMLDRQCGEPAYEAWFDEAGADDLFYAWRVTCLTYFEGDLTADQVDETKRMLIERTIEESAG